MIVTVTVNPCIDVEKEFDKNLAMDGTNRPLLSNENPGGKGIDVSRAIRACGETSLALGFVGGHTGKRVQGLLAIEDIDTDFIETGSETRTNIILRVQTKEKEGPKHEECRVNSAGPKITEIQYNELRKAITEKKDVKAAAICGSVPPGMENPASYNALLKAFKDANEHCLTYLDTGQKHTLAALTATHPPDFIKPNIEEFNQLLVHSMDVDLLDDDDRKQPDNNKPSPGDETLLKNKYCLFNAKIGTTWLVLLEYLERFSKKYNKTTILLSMSELGAITYSKKEFIHCYYVGSTEPSTFVGAGDSFLGGFIVAQAKEKQIEKAIKAGVATSIARLTGGGGSDKAYIDGGSIIKFLKDDLLCVSKFKKVEECTKHLENVIEKYNKAEEGIKKKRTKEERNKTK